MKVTYLFHSGYLVETDRCCYIFDYWKGQLPELDPEKPVVVFSSHTHHDHYEPQIFSLLAEQGVKNVRAVLSYDIDPAGYPAGIDVLAAQPRQRYELPFGGTLETLQSTDAGVAFLLTTDEGVIYHAGDLNDWHWEGEPNWDNDAMEAAYREELRTLEGREIDVAFVLLDPRQGEQYADGMLWFLEQIGARRVYPMHYWEKPEIITRFLDEYPKFKGTVQFPE